jgi:hypothetical protein
LAAQVEVKLKYGVTHPGSASLEAYTEQAKILSPLGEKEAEKYIALAFLLN